MPLWDSIVMSDASKTAPTLAFWDFARHTWRLDGFSNVSLDTDMKLLKFETVHVAPITMLQKRGLHHTIHDWEVRPVSGDDQSGAAVSLTVVGEHLTTEFIISSAGVRLVRPESAAPNLRETFSAPKDFVKSMCGSGLDIFPGE